MELVKINEGTYHLKDNNFFSLLSRYGEFNEKLTNYFVKKDVFLFDNSVTFDEKKIEIFKDEFSYFLKINLDKDERLYGLGDSCRDSIQLLDKKYLLKTSNVSCYGPMPIILSSFGYALIVNTTYASVVDVNSKDKYVKITVKSGKPDFYLTFANNLKELIIALTDITGKSTMLPSFAYGLTIVQNERTNVDSLLENARIIRDRKIPCDVFGLEPGWMETIYDTSVNKCWSKDRFPLPSWHDENYCGSQTFFYPLREKGINLSLWLCENYDVFYEEERKLGNEYNVGGKSEFDKDAEIFDAHLNSPVMTDRVTKIDEPFFKHLEKFVNNGAQCFKLDGYTQVLEHPDRYWGMKYHDDEIHNLYPLILAKQMKEGFENLTGRRAMIYTAGAYTGTQKYAATWAGDTGGGPRVLNSLLNYAMLGHSNTSCDLDITNDASIHYAFLSGWTQLNVWAYHYYPWNLSKEKEDTFRFYSELRSSLFPYIYKYAHEAATVGLPIVRPMVLEYEEKKFFNNKKDFMLGENFFVANNFEYEKGSSSSDYVDSDSFKTNIKFNNKLNIELPDGIWVDFFNDKEYSGNISYEILNNRGGALFIKKDSVIVTMKPQQFINEKNHEYIINVYGNGSFTLYEDDGYTNDYKNGGFATTKIISTVNDKEVVVEVQPREGNFTGRPNNGFDIINNSIPLIKGICEQNNFEVVLHNIVAKTLKINDKNVEFVVENNLTKFVIESSILSNKVVCKIER